MKSMIESYILFVIVAAIALSAPGCEEESPTSTHSIDQIMRLADNVYVIDDDSPIALEHIDDSIYIYAIVKYPPIIEPGDIIIGADGGGYVRRVIGVEVTRDRMSIETAGCKLAEAVVMGEAELVSYIGFGSPEYESGKSSIELAPSAALAGGGVSLSGLTLFEGDVGGQPASITIEEGHIEFDPRVAIGFAIHDHIVHAFRYQADATLSYRLGMAVDVPAELTSGGEMRIATVRVTAVHQADKLPITLLLELELLLGWEFNGRFAGDCATTYIGEYGITEGAYYASGVWSDIGTADPALLSSNLRCIDYAETSGFRIAIRPRISVSLFGERAAITDAAAEAGFAASTSIPPIWSWSTFGRYADSSLVRPECIGAAPPSYTSTATRSSAITGTGPYQTDYYIFELLWGREGSAAGEFLYPRGAATDAEGNVYVADSGNHRIQKFAADSTFILKWGREGHDAGQFLMPTDVAVDGDGYVYVTDSGNNRVQKFTQDIAFVTSWGIYGNGSSEFDVPTGIATDIDGNVYVVDTGNHRVEKFTPEGVYITEWGGYGSGPGQFDMPRGVAADLEGHIYVTECRNNRVQKFTLDGFYVDSWGSYGTAEGEFDCPIAIEVAELGAVFIVDYGNNRLQKFTSDGIYITSIGMGDAGEAEFDRPEGVALAPSGRLYIVDSRNSRIQKFAPLP